MLTDYHVPFRSEEFLAGVAAVCWQATPTSRSNIFDVIALVEILRTKGVEHVVRSWRRVKGKLRLQFFDREGIWDDPAYVTFNPITLHVDNGIWVKANALDPDACFVIAHELGHILIHDHDAAAAFSVDKSLRIGFSEKEYSAEWQSNTFAGHLVLPTDTVKKFLHHGDEFVAALCNAPLQLAKDRIAAIRATKKVLHAGALTDYCVGCGNLQQLIGGYCNDCQPQ